jgi:two-component system heavy metal sensor histidine kinase CusS
LHAIKREAAAITADRLHSRLPTESIPVELVDLAETLNQMLARLEDSFRRLSDFSSDIAHELRTPVSNLLTQTQVMLSRARTIDEYQDVLASNAEELERMAKMIADMLFLAKADNDLVVPNLEAVDLRAEAEGLASFYEAVAEENGVTLTVDGNATVSGDRLMLRRAMGNLLSNAFGHTPQRGIYSNSDRHERGSNGNDPGRKLRRDDPAGTSAAPL